MGLLRVKRRIEEEPIPAVVITSKKPKTEDIDYHTTVFKFAATVVPKDTDIPRQLQSVKHQLNSETSSGSSRSVESIVKKIKDEHEELSKSNRLKVINCFRSIDTLDDSTEVAENSKGITVVDLEQENEISENEKSEVAVEAEYVYDIYYVNEENDKFLENIACAYGLTDEILFEEFQDEESNQTDDDDDSNDENNWRNNYPDEDEFSSENDNIYNSDDENIIADNLIRLQLDSDNLSSEDDENLIFSDEVDVISNLNSHILGYGNYSRHVVRDMYDSSTDSSISDYYDAD